MKIRLDKMLSNIGIGSRKQIKQNAKSNGIKVNNKIVKDSSQIIDTDIDQVEYKGKPVKYIQYIYIMMNKPSGVVSATEDNHDRTVIDLLTEQDRHFNPFPVGRLDKDTEGLLILTNNGQLTHNLLSPKKHVDKTYYVQIKGILTEADVREFASGIVLTDDGYQTLPSKLNIIETKEQSKCYVTIKEGKFHQIKRMFESVEKEVTYLKRLSMGPIELDATIKLGEYRHLTESEIELIQDYM